jgi:iron(III) transport system permease protein
MLAFRWLRSVARSVLGVMLIAPVVALPLAISIDRGPAGETRTALHLFPLALWLFDDFARTCARNSLIFASVVSIASLVIGGVLGWLIGRRRFWGRMILRGLLGALLAVSPAFQALGLLGLSGDPRPWPWPFAGGDGVSRGVSLETWTGLPLWLVWIWTTLPAGVALVTLATLAAVEALDPSGEDAARLAGAGTLRAWRTLSWPLVRPRSALAGAVVFLFALVEPGAPLVLGLRRTLAFQIVDSATRPEAFPAAAVWALMSALLGLLGWLLWRWGGRRTMLNGRRTAMIASQGKGPPRAASAARAFVSTVVLAISAVIGWLPVFGLIQLALGASPSEPSSSSDFIQGFAAIPQRLSNPRVPQLLSNSLLLGFEVACAAIAVAWLIGPRSLHRSSAGLRGRLTRMIALFPPLVQGIGVLAIPWLADLASAFVIKVEHATPVVTALGSVASRIDRYHDPWPLLVCGVGLVLVPRLLWCGHTEFQAERARATPSSSFDAARLAGASRARSGRLSEPLPVRRLLSLFCLACALAATNLTPALLFEPWSDGRTIAPAVVVLAGGVAEERSLAATLALAAIALNASALCAARLTHISPGRAVAE